MRQGVLFLALILCVCSLVNANQIYYTEGGWGATRVYKYDTSGQNNQLLLSSHTYTYVGVTVDTTSNKIYLAGRDYIQRANGSDGSDLEQLVMGSFTSEGIVLDPSSEKIYWSSFAGPWMPSSEGKIYRSNLDGSNIEILHSVTDRINGLALDLVHDKIYWTQIEEINSYERSSWICRSNLDGSSIEYLTQGIEILGIALDVISEKMYWTDWMGQKVCRANFDGSDVEIIYHSYGNPHSITLDTVNQKAYWTEWNTNVIFQSNFDGTHLEPILPTGPNPAGIFFSGTASAGPSGLIALSEYEVGLEIHGLPELYIEGGGIYVNSWHYDALRIIGDAFGRGESLISEINVVGDYRISSRILDNLQTANDGFPTILRNGVDPIPDPLEDIPELPLMPVSPTAFVGEISGGNHILEPGYYPEGIEINGGNITMLPGMYQIDSNGYGRGLSIRGNVNLLADQVMFHLLAGGLDVHSQGNIVLTPPLDGPYQGISIFQSRYNWEFSDIICNDLDIAGVLYFPTAHLNLAIFGGEGIIGSRIIANMIEIHGDGLIRIVSPHPVEYPILNISTTQFKFKADEGRENPSPQTLLIKNTGVDTLNWKIVENCPWLEVNPVSGQSTGEFDEVTISVDTDGLVQGQYNCTILIEADGAFNSPQAIDINLTVHGPRIDLSEKKIDFYLTDSVVTPESHTYTITNGAGGTLNWNLSYECDWFTVDPISGISTQESNEVKIYPGDLSSYTIPGHHRCEIVITGENALNSPQVVEAMLHVEGELKVPEHYPTIQAAIDASIDGDVVVVSEGIYQGDGNRDLNYSGRSITVRSVDPDDPDVVAATVIDCEGTPANPHRGFNFFSGENNNAVVSGLTIINGYGPNKQHQGGISSVGGAICSYNSSPTITKCIMKDNYGERGGAIYGNNSSITVTDCDIYNNSSDTSAVHVRIGRPSIIRCIINENASRGIWILGCTRPSIKHCEIIRNVSAGRGGGIYTNGNRESFKIENCVISNNSSGSGSGILCERENVNLSITNCTISNNNAGGIYNYRDLGKKPILKNCIVWGNTASNNPQIAGYVRVSFSNIQGGYSGSGNINAEPLFCDPNHFDYHLLPGSPCKNTGDPAGNYSGQTDIDGQPRMMDGRVDMGADEMVPNIAPVADAGEDVAAFAWIDGYAEIQLDGTVSSDADGDALEYFWYDGNDLIVTGAEPNVMLPVGEHAIDLIVNDGIEDSEPNDVVITVIEATKVPMNLTPRTLNCRSQGNWLKAHFTLPEAFSISDIDLDRTAVVDSYGIESALLEVSVNKEKSVEITASFDRKQICSLAGDWPGIFRVYGFFTDGTVFFGESGIRIHPAGLKEVSELASYWLLEDCGHPDWCDGLDLNRDLMVNMQDYPLLLNSEVEFTSE